MLHKMKFMNIRLDNVTMKEAVDAIDELAQGDAGAYVVTPNVDHMIMLQKDALFKEIYDNASLVLTDGKPLVWISRLYKTPIKEKVSGSDLFPELCRRCAQKGYKMFFLGAAEGVAAKAAVKLQKKFPGLCVVGTYSPPYGFEKDEQELNKIVDTIRKAAPQVLIVGLGAPKQEKFIYAQRERLNVPVSLGLGASLDFEAGNVKRAPRWMCNCGLEWFYRLCREPKRMFKRYVINDTKIIGLYFKYRRKSSGRH